MNHDPVLDRLRAADPQDPPADTSELLASVTRQLETTATPTSTGSSRRRLVVPLAAALLAVTAGTAIATGVPDDVIHMFSRGPAGNGEAARVCEVDDPLQYATQVASAPWRPGRTSNEGRAELWVAPTTTSNLYVGLRTVGPDGQLHGLSGGCGLDNPDVWTNTSGDYPIDDPDAGNAIVYGRTDIATSRVLIEFSTGATVTADVNQQGYYVTTVLGDPRPYTDADGTPTITAID